MYFVTIVHSSYTSVKKRLAYTHNDTYVHIRQFDSVSVYKSLQLWFQAADGKHNLELLSMKVIN